MIVLISGTSGSGKTYIVQRLLEELGPSGGDIHLGPRGKQAGYVWPFRNVVVMGTYTTACGGCDGLSWKGGADDIEAEVLAQRAIGRKVVLEGLLVATWGVPRLGRMVPEGLRVIHLTTPVEECIASVLERRAARAAETGKEVKPFNPANTAGKHHGLLSVLPARRAAGIPVEELDRAGALARVKELIL